MTDHDLSTSSTAIGGDGGRESGSGNKSEEVAISCRMIESPFVSKNHFGLNYLIRSWISLSLKRRSFNLWAKAGSLAVQCGISMDDILCDSPSGQRRGMDHLFRFMLNPVEEQESVGTKLQVNEVPDSLWRAIGIETIEQENAVSLLEDRWIFIRHLRCGVSRFYTSPGFERDIVALSRIEDTYRANKMDIADLYLVKENHHGHADLATLGFAHQLSLHSKPGTVTRATKIPNVWLRTTALGNIEVDQLWCLAITDLDESFGLAEFVVRKDDDDDDNTGGEETLLLYSTSLPVDTTNLFTAGDEDDDMRYIYDLLQSS